jgi:hypothetical protein
MDPYRRPPRRPPQAHVFDRHAVWPEWMFVAAAAFVAAFVALLVGCGPSVGPRRALAAGH